MAFEVEGTIKLIMDTQTFGSGFTKREFVVTIGDEKYPQDIKMEVVKDKTSLLDRYKVGQRVKIGFDLRGNEHNGRYYVTVQAWRIHAADGSDGGSSGGGEVNAPRTSAPPRQDRPAPRQDRGGGERKRDWSDDRGGGGRKDWDDERRGGRREEYRGGKRGGGGHEDDIDF